MKIDKFRPWRRAENVYESYVWCVDVLGEEKTSISLRLTAAANTQHNIPSRIVHTHRVIVTHFLYAFGLFVSLMDMPYRRAQPSMARLWSWITGYKYFKWIITQRSVATRTNSELENRFKFSFSTQQRPRNLQRTHQLPPLTCGLCRRQNCLTHRRLRRSPRYAINKSSMYKPLVVVELWIHIYCTTPAPRLAYFCVLLQNFVCARQHSASSTLTRFSYWFAYSIRSLLHGVVVDSGSRMPCTGTIQSNSSIYGRSKVPHGHVHCTIEAYPQDHNNNTHAHCTWVATRTIHTHTRKHTTHWDTQAVDGSKR